MNRKTLRVSSGVRICWHAACDRVARKQSEEDAAGQFKNWASFSDGLLLDGPQICVGEFAGGAKTFVCAGVHGKSQGSIQ